MSGYQTMVVSLLVVSTFLVTYVHTATSERPHIIVIVADDLGWDDVSFHGSEEIPTPNLDALAYSGVMLKNYYVQPICTPSRSALMTGRHPIHLGLQHGVINSAAPYGLGLNETVMPQYLKELGYKTHMVGKWHLGYYKWEYTPVYRGFDSFFGYMNGCEDYYDHTIRDYRKQWGEMWGLDFYNNKELVKDKYGIYSEEIFTSRAEEVIQQHNASEPLFLYFPHQGVHSGNPVTPLEAPWKYLKNFDHIQHKGRRTFAAMVSVVDDSVGNITKALHAKGMLDNSIIVFTTDNGGPAAGYDMNYASNYPMRGMKNTLWEGGVHGAGFIWSPLLKPHKSDSMIHICDWLPTLLHAAGYDMSKLENKSLDAIDQWESLLQISPSKRREIIHNIDPKSKMASAIRVGDYKLVRHLPGAYSGWYKPESVLVSTLNGNFTPLIDVYSKYNDKISDAALQGKFVDADGYVIDTTYQNNLQDKGNDVSKVSAPAHMYHSDLYDIIETTKIGKIHDDDKTPIKIDCGQRPANASSNCDSQKAPCLYDISKDPCEYNNLADMYPGIVDELMKILSYYERTMVPVKNKPIDPASFPPKHGGAWVPWVKDTVSFK